LKSVVEAKYGVAAGSSPGRDNVESHLPPRPRNLPKQRFGLCLLLQHSRLDIKLAPERTDELSFGYQPRYWLRLGPLGTMAGLAIAALLRRRKGVGERSTSSSSTR
jgi:hypothetical protein